MENSSSNWYLIVTIIFLTTLIISFYGFIIYKTIKNYNQQSLLLQRNIEDLKFKQEKLLLQTEIEIQEQTFQFISMEIHDNITQVLSLSKLHLNCLELNKDAENLDRLTKSKDLISKSLEDLSNLSKSLDSDIIESHGLTHAIQYEIERWKRFTDDKIELELIGNVEFLKHKNELLIFRIIQEALNNIIKYAKASCIVIKIERNESELIISIKDNGIGFDLEKVYENKKVGKMSGLKNMRQRAEILGGKLTINSRPGNGSTIEAIIPVNIKSLENDKNSIGRRSQTIA
ncbi:MAG TPA: ATP-binding protein [Chitinophagaceae bacterium]|nr:ATP-binding protein [Chitinophagaceae bacterium]